MAMELDSEMKLIVQVRLIAKGHDLPVSGNAFKVRLYDKDIFNDDFLGESPVHDGMARFTITPAALSDAMDLDNKPDFYFVVFKNDSIIFKSKVMSNLDITDMEQFIQNEGELVDLGTFLIDVDAVEVSK